MKYLRMFEAATGLFPTKVKVTLIDAFTGESLGSYKVLVEILPVSFNRPITIEINDVKWRVLQADPIMAEDFLFTKKLTLKVKHADNDGIQLKFDLPTLSNQLPATTETSFYNDFTMELLETDWQQIEFLPLSHSIHIEESIKIIDEILAGQSNPLLGYENQYLRDNVSQKKLSIPWKSFCHLLVNPIYGNVFLNNKGFVRDGFAIRSDSQVYYGILENGFICALCLRRFDWTDDEFMNILSTYDLVLVDWCKASRISAELGEKPKSEFIDM